MEIEDLKFPYDFVLFRIKSKFPPQSCGLTIAYIVHALRLLDNTATVQKGQSVGLEAQIVRPDYLCTNSTLPNTSYSVPAPRDPFPDSMLCSQSAEWVGTGGDCFAYSSDVYHLSITPPLHFHYLHTYQSSLPHRD